MLEFWNQRHNHGSYMAIHIPTSNTETSEARQINEDMLDQFCNITAIMKAYEFQILPFAFKTWKISRENQA